MSLIRFNWRLEINILAILKVKNFEMKGKFNSQSHVLFDGKKEIVLSFYTEEIVLQIMKNKLSLFLTREKDWRHESLNFLNWYRTCIIWWDFFSLNMKYSSLNERSTGFLKALHEKKVIYIKSLVIYFKCNEITEIELPIIFYFL